MERQQVLDIIKNQVELLKDTFPKDGQFEVTDDLVLFGQDSKVDSLSLVSLIVDIEALFFDDYNEEISLTDDNAMTRPISPFSTISSLTDYIFEILSKK